MNIVKVIKAEPIEKFLVRMEFSDGVTKAIDLEPYLHGGIFEAIRNDPALFHGMRVDAGTIAWPNGADIDPLVLRYDLPLAELEDAHEEAIDLQTVNQ